MLLHLGEDLKQPGDVRGGSSRLPVELQDSDQLIFGDLLLEGDATVNCGRGGQGWEGGWGSEPPDLALSGSALIPAALAGILRFPLRANPLSMTRPPPPAIWHARPFPSLCCGCQGPWLGQQLIGDRGFRQGVSEPKWSDGLTRQRFGNNEQMCGGCDGESGRTSTHKARHRGTGEAVTRAAFIRQQKDEPLVRHSHPLNLELHGDHVN